MFWLTTLLRRKCFVFSTNTLMCISQVHTLHTRNVYMCSSFQVLYRLQKCIKRFDIVSILPQHETPIPVLLLFIPCCGCWSSHVTLNFVVTDLESSWALTLSASYLLKYNDFCNLTLFNWVQLNCIGTVSQRGHSHFVRGICKLGCCLHSYDKHSFFCAYCFLQTHLHLWSPVRTTE